MTGDMGDFNAPMPPMDTDPNMMPGPDEEDPNAMGEEPGMDDMGGAEDPNAMGEDENVSPEVQDFIDDFKSADPETQDGTIKYFDSQKKDAGDEQLEQPEQPDMGMPTESRFSFRSIINEIFGETEPKRIQDKGTTDRPQKEVEEDAITDCDSPYLPR